MAEFYEYEGVEFERMLRRRRTRRECREDQQIDAALQDPERHVLIGRTGPDFMEKRTWCHLYVIRPGWLWWRRMSDYRGSGVRRGLYGRYWTRRGAIEAALERASDRIVNGEAVELVAGLQDD